MGKVTSIFDLDEFKGLKGRWDARQTAILHSRGYYDGSAYKRLQTSGGFFGPRLYKNIRALYLPLSRAVDVDCGVVPGGWTLVDDAQWAEEPRRQVFNWSRWSTEGVLMLHYGASTGVSVLKIVDDRLNNRIYLQPVDPSQTMLVGGMYDQTPSIALTVLRQTDGDGEYEYAEVITSDRIRTYRDGEPYGYEGRQPEYQNALGFVPMVECGHVRVSNTGAMPGVSTFQNAIPLLDECNQLASHLVDVVRRNAEPQWIVTGAAPAELTHDGQQAWFLPKDAEAKTLTPTVDIQGVLAFVQEVRDQVTNGLPELAFDDLRKRDNIASSTLSLQLSELTIKIARIRVNYDAMLVEALRMAGRAAATMGLTDIARLQDLEDGAIDQNREILPLDVETRLRIESMELALEQQKRSMNGGEGVYQQNPPARNKREKKAQSDEQEQKNSEQNEQSEE